MIYDLDALKKELDDWKFNNPATTRGMRLDEIARVVIAELRLARAANDALVRAVRGVKCWHCNGLGYTEDLDRNTHSPCEHCMLIQTALVKAGKAALGCETGWYRELESALALAAGKEQPQ